MRTESERRRRDARQVVTLMLEGMDYSEIAQVLGISESNVGARLSRARQVLRELMEVAQ